MKSKNPIINALSSVNCATVSNGEFEFCYCNIHMNLGEDPGRRALLGMASKYFTAGAPLGHTALCHEALSNSETKEPQIFEVTQLDLP